jgi:hypothetical protein
MNTLKLDEPVWPFAGRTITFYAGMGGVDVHMEFGVDTVSIPWDNTMDTEYLAKIYRGVYVYEFEAVVKGLGNITRAYHAML